MLFTLFFLFNFLFSDTFTSPPAGDVFSSTDKTRGIWFSPPVDMWVVGIRFPDTIGQGRQVLDIVYINGPPAQYPAQTNVISLFHYKRTDIGSLWPNITCVTPTLLLSRNGYYGILGGRVVDEVIGNVTAQYSVFNEFTVGFSGGQNMLTKRLMVQKSILNTASDFASTDDSNPLAMMEIFFYLTQPVTLPTFCQGIPPDPDSTSSTSSPPNQNSFSSSNQIFSVFL